MGLMNKMGKFIVRQSPFDDERIQTDTSNYDVLMYREIAFMRWVLGRKMGSRATRYRCRLVQRLGQRKPLKKAWD